MRIGIVVDSTCDLPIDFIHEHDITILPITVRIDEHAFVDHRDPVATLKFFHDKLGDRAHAADTEPFSTDQVHQLFLDELVTKFDAVFCLTITASRSLIYENTLGASYAILKDYHSVRTAAGLSGPFLMRVIDTQTLFAGQVPSAWEGVRLIGSNASPGQIRERLEQVAANSTGYFLPRDLYYLRARAQKRGDRSVGWITATLGSALNIKPIVRAYRKNTQPAGKVRGFEAGAEALFQHTIERVKVGLMVPVVSLSYGGELDDLRTLPGYQSLCDVCAEHGVSVLESVMSMTAMVHVGAEGLAVGFACEPYDVSF